MTIAPDDDIEDWASGPTAALDASVDIGREITEPTHDDGPECAPQAESSEPPTPDARAIPEADGFLKIVLPLPATPRPLWWSGALHAARERAVYAAKRRVALLLVALLVALTLGGAGYLATDYYAPAVVANGFCADLQSGRISAAYARLSSDLDGQISVERFQLAAQALDEGEGRISSCSVGVAPDAYGRSPGAARATTQVTINRAHDGTLRGRLTLAREDGVWRITAIDAAALGADLPALGVVSAYCGALRERDYLAAYTLLGQSLQDTLPFPEFVELMRSAEQIDGAIQNCGLARIQGGQATGGATLLSIVRRVGEHRGVIVLSAQGGYWEITSIGPTALSSDLGPLRTGARFCVDLLGGKLDDAYALLSVRFRTQVTEVQFTDDLRPDAGARWTGCTPDLRSYHIEDTQAYFDISLTATFDDGATSVSQARLMFAQIDARWWLDGVQF
jgi:hypothetical protein